MSAVCRNLWYVSLDSMSGSVPISRAMKFNTRKTDIRIQRIMKHVVEFRLRPRLHYAGGI